MEVFNREYQVWRIPGASDHLILKCIEVETPIYDRDEINDPESEIFSAIQHKGNIYAHVTLMTRVGNEVIYKGMHEFVGPYTKAKCPKEIMSMLSDLTKFDTEYFGEMDSAKEWRKKQ